MQKRVKNGIKEILRKFGYQLVRLERIEVLEQNFRSLASAYESVQADAGKLLSPPDALRAELMQRLLGTRPAQAYEIVALLSKTNELNGDVCEFGVAQGETSALIANEIRAHSNVLHLFDSFEGLPAPSQKDQLKDDIASLGSIEAYQGTMACPEDMVQARLTQIGFPESRYQIHKGFIEDLIQYREGFPDQVSFAYVDFDFYEPILIALQFLDEVLVPGGSVMVDDYDYFSSGAKTAVTEFLEEVNAESERYTIHVADPKLGHFAVLTRTDNPNQG